MTQEKLQRYADGLPVEDTGRPPPLPGATGARLRRGSRSKGERSGGGGGGANRLSPSSSLTEQTGCSETESVLEPLEEPDEKHADAEHEESYEHAEHAEHAESKAELPPTPSVAHMLHVQDANEAAVIPVAELPLTGLPVGKVSGHQGMEVKEDILEVSQVPEELAQEPVEEPLEPDELEEVEVESNLSISLHIRI